MPSFTTPEEIDFYRAVVIRAGLRLDLQGIKPTRHWRRRDALTQVSRWTGKKYTTRAESVNDAIKDISRLIRGHKHPVGE